MSYGKTVCDLNIDTDVVLLSNDVEALSSTIVNNTTIAVSNNVVQHIQNNLASIIDMDALSTQIYDALKVVLDDYVLKRMLSTMMFDIISTYNDTVIDCLDGNPDDEANVDAGGAFS